MTFHSGGGFGFAPGPISVVPSQPFVPGGGGITFQPPPPQFPEPFDAQGVVEGVACAAGKHVLCQHPISRPIYERLCGPCDTPFVDPMDPGGIGDVDRLIPAQPIPSRPQGGGGGCVPCGPNECKVVVGVDRCGQPRTRKGRLVVGPNGTPVCVPKKPRMNPLNAKANRRSMSRLKGAHREAKKIIDTLDKFAKPRRSTAGRARAAAASCKCK